jgi:enoyl-CoA hydratase/carnithine racemase
VKAVDALKIDRVGATLIVTLNHPDRLNALDDQMRDELEKLWTDVGSESDLRCVIITGQGRGFCAGADMASLSSRRRSRGDLDSELAFLPGRRIDIPVIAAINGVCAGGGLHFVADADIVVAADSAVFVDPHVSVGQVSGIEPSSLVIRVGFEQITRMALLGKAYRLGAVAALAAGLVGEIVPDEELMPRALDHAKAICNASPTAIRATRLQLRDLASQLLEPSMAKGWRAVQAHWAHPDAREGPLAFSERREPRWSK